MDTFKTAVILAGGMSSRMGFDKQLLRIGGRSVMDTLIYNLGMEFKEIIIVANKFYGEYTGCMRVSDRIKMKGPLGGIHAGLCESSSRYVYFISCDMPNINRDYIKFMKNSIENVDVDACVMRHFNGCIEPFNGFYSTKMVEYMGKFLREKRRSVKNFLKTVNTVYIGENTAVKYSPDLDMFFNINTKEDICKYYVHIGEMSGMTKVTYDDMKIFEGLDEATLDILTQKCFKKKLSKGEILFHEKDNVDQIYIVLKGKVTIYKISENGQKRIIYILDNGNLINDDIFENSSVSVSCEAFEDSSILFIPIHDFMDIMSMNFRFTTMVVKSMSKKIRRLYRQLKNAVPIRMDKKLAAKLWKLTRDYGVNVEDGVLINLDISITYLADMLGSTRETISRCISDFKKKNMVKLRGRKIIVTDPDILSSYFKGI